MKDRKGFLNFNFGHAENSSLAAKWVIPLKATPFLSPFVLVFRQGSSFGTSIKERSEL